MYDPNKIRFKPDGTPDWDALRRDAEERRRAMSQTEGPTDIDSLLRAPVQEPPKPAIAPTDFQSLGGAMRAPARYQRRSFSDWLVDFLTPLFIFVMIASVVFFLLDVRYVYTEVQDKNLRWVAFFFVVGVVALNRLIAREGSQESFLYFLGLAGAVTLYTFAMTSEYGGIGSMARGFLDSPGWAVTFNLILVFFIWWVTNRLTHECCVDDNPEAGQIGILTGTIRGFQLALRSDRKQDAGPDFYDPMEWTPEMRKRKPPSAQVPTASRRLPKRHPGISIFYISILVFIVFALGLRVLRHGGAGMVLAGHFFVGCYTVSALMLLMLSSLGGLRQYFRSREIHLPNGLGPFWLGLGTVMVVVVLVAASALPLPSMPPLAHIDRHETDFWTRHSTFEVQSVAAAPVDILRQSQVILWVGRGVLALLTLFTAYGALRSIAAAAAAAARNRDVLPRFVVRGLEVLDRLLQRLTRLPRMPHVSLPKRRRIQRNISESVKYTNPLRDPGTAARMTTADMVVYAYDALCALALDLGVPRDPDETPYEFIQRFPKPLQSLQEEALELTQLYVRTVYAPGVVDERIRDRLRKFWIAYEAVRRRVVV